MVRLPAGLPDFAGCWRLSRRITDRSGGQSGHAEGRVEFLRDGAALRYCETLTLYLPGQGPISGTRNYVWLPDPVGIAVTFDDGRPFHRIALGQGAPRDVHDCGADRYAVTYDFADWPVWAVTWEVTGPRKDYRMETLFVREKLREG